MKVGTGGMRIKSQFCAHWSKKNLENKLVKVLLLS